MNCFHFLLLISLTICTQARYAKIVANLALTVVDDAPIQFNAELLQLCERATNMFMQELQQLQAQDLSNATETMQYCPYEQLGLLQDHVLVELEFIGRCSVLSKSALCSQQECQSIKCETAFKLHQCKQQLKVAQLHLEQLYLETKSESAVAATQ